jgi:hypothetical protein
MKVKLTYPVPGHEYQVGHIIDIDPQKAKVWIKNEWCAEVADESERRTKLVRENFGSKPFPEPSVPSIKESSKVKHDKGSNANTD